MSPLSVVSLNVACAAALSSTGSANVMITGAANPTVVPLGIWNDARMVFSGLTVCSVPVNGSSAPVESTVTPLTVYVVLYAKRWLSVQVA